MYDIAIDQPQILRNLLIDIIGETVECQGTQIRRIAAREIVKRDKIMFNASDRDAVIVEFADLEYRLARPSTYFARELLNEPVPYSADGILFPVLVHLVRSIEEDLFGWGWLPEQVRALALAVNPGEELAWATSLDSYEVRNRKGKCRVYYHFS
jgi:hypothetical protein